MNVEASCLSIPLGNPKLTFYILHRMNPPVDLTSDRERVKVLLNETVTLLCKNGLSFKSSFKIEGLLGITIDDNEVFLVNINESISGKSSVSCKIPQEISPTSSVSSLESKGRRKRCRPKRVKNNEWIHIQDDNNAAPSITLHQLNCDGEAPDCSSTKWDLNSNLGADFGPPPAKKPVFSDPNELPVIEVKPEPSDSYSQEINDSLTVTSQETSDIWNSSIAVPDQPASVTFATGSKAVSINSVVYHFS